MIKTPRVLFFILVLGLIMRLWGVNFGLPQVYHADEPIVVNHAIAYGSGDLNPHFFIVPPLVSYLVFVQFGVFFLLGKIIGMFGGMSDFLYLFLSDPSAFYLIARISMGVVLGVATIWLLYILARRVFDQRVALVAAFFLSVNFLHVRNSHYVYCDIGAVFAILVFYLTTLHVYERPTLKNYCLAAFTLGLAGVFKYNAALAGVALVTVHCLINWKNPRRMFFDHKLYLFFILSGVFFIIFNPYSILDFRHFYRDVSGQLGGSTSPGFLHHITYSLMQGASPAVSLCALVGFVASFVRLRKKALWFGSFFIVYLLLISTKSQLHERYILPIIPFVCVYAAVGIVTLTERSAFTRRRPKMLIPIVLVISLVSFAKCVYVDILFSRPDTRTIAKEWVETHIPAGSRIAISDALFSIQLIQGPDQIKEKMQGAQGPRRKKLETLLGISQDTQKTYSTFFLLRKDQEVSGFLADKPNLTYSRQGLNGANIRYVVMILHTMIPERIELREYLQRKAKLIKTVSPYHRQSTKVHTLDIYSTTYAPFLDEELFSRRYNGPYIEIYQLD